MRDRRGSEWAVLLTLGLGFFMTLLDLTIVNIAIPNMIDKLHASLDDVLWVLNAYALVLAVLVITAGRLGDLIGPGWDVRGEIATKLVVSVRKRDEILVRHIRRIQRRLDARPTGRCDWPWGEPFVFVRVVGRVDLEIFVIDARDVLAEHVLHRGIGL